MLFRSNSPSLTQTFITVNNEPSLPNSRYFGAGLGLSASDSGAQGSYVLSLTGTAASLENALTGIIVKTGTGTVAARTFTVGSGLSITNGDGVSGNPNLTVTGLLSALAGTSGTGLLATAGGTTLAPITIQGTADEIDVINGNTSPVIGLADNPVLPGTGAVSVPIEIGRAHV